MSETANLLITELKKVQIELPIDRITKLLAFIDLLLETNKVVNLTAITDYQEALFKHIFDSLIILNRPEYVAARQIFDVGSGGGIPGIPLAICSPEKQFISLDSVQKKIKFQEHACQSLQITNLQPLWGRAEDFNKGVPERQLFDLALARAVAPLNILIELTLPFMKVNGFAIFYKGKEYQNELQNASPAITLMGGRLNDAITTELPLNYGTRSLIIIQKTSATPPGYPRKAGVPQKKPL